MNKAHEEEKKLRSLNKIFSNITSRSIRLTKNTRLISVSISACSY